MRHYRILGAAMLAAVLAVPALDAQAFKSMSLSGSTGLYSIPSGRIGWEQDSKLAFDLGYHTIIRDGTATHIPKIGASLFRWVELSAAFDIQPETYSTSRGDGTDFIGGVKVQFPLRNTALALGGNFQALNLGDDYRSRMGGQVYVAVT